MLRNNKIEIIKKHIAGVIDNPSIEELRSFYKFVGKIKKDTPSSGFSIPRRIVPYLRDNPRDRIERKRFNKLDEILKRKESV